MDLKGNVLFTILRRVCSWFRICDQSDHLKDCPFVTRFNVFIFNLCRNYSFSDSGGVIKVMA
jgi:hypothetical protein